jgi:ribosome-associated protein
MLVVSRHWTIPREELQISYVRSSGPGGQNVNKVASKAVVRWSLVGSTSVADDVRVKLRQRLASRLTVDGDLVISSQRFRAAPRNLEDCLEKLGGVLKAALREKKPRRQTRPTAGSRRRRRAEKQQHSARKHGRRLPPDD